MDGTWPIAEYFMPFLDSENDARGAKKGNKPRVLHNAIVVLFATYRYKHDTSKVERYKYA